MKTIQTTTLCTVSSPCDPQTRVITQRGRWVEQSKFCLITFFNLILLLVIHQTLFAQSKGTISGTVVDSKNKEPLPSVNVIVKGTYYGAATNLDGKFTIQNVNPGTYVVEVSLLGYKSMQYSSVKVQSGETTTLDIKMEETVLSIGQEMVIVGEKPLFNLEETQSRRSATSEDIQAAAVKSVQDVVSLQSGVVQSDNEIHIRGGRSYENAYLVDGVSVQDPLAGMGFGMQLSPASIQEAEVITGGYNAEYGQATSGIVNITTKEGATKFSGSVSYKRDHFGFNDDTRSNFNTDIIEFSLSGPEPISSFLFSKKNGASPLSFFVSLYANRTDGYTRWVEDIQSGKPIGYEVKVPNNLYSSLLPSSPVDLFLDRKRSNVGSWLGKLTWKPIATFKVTYSHTNSISIDQNSQTIGSTLERVEPNPGFQYDFQNIPDSSNTFTQVNLQHTISLTHTLSSKSFYEVRLSKYSSHVRGDANGKYFSLYNEPKDVITLPVEYYNENKDTIGVIPGDGFYDVGNPTRWRDHNLEEYTLKGDFTNNFTEKHKFKTGFEHRYQVMQMVDIVSPWFKPLGLNNDVYGVFPNQGALYAQDNITIKGMILNFGLRLDYWFPGKFVDDALTQPAESINVAATIQKAYFDETMELFGHRFKARMSPRLGISHPVSDNQTLFFSYGHFSKLPRPQFVYSKLERTSAKSSFQTVGNPNLNPETTVSYELGLRNQFGESDVMTVTAYYKDIFDYITARSVRQTGARRGSYTTYINQDYSRVRGLEIEYKTRFTQQLRATVSGSYSIATGKSSSADEAIFSLTQGVEENIKEVPMIFDRPLQLSANVSLNSKKNEPLFGFGKGILEDYNLFFRLFYQSGKRYTYQEWYYSDPVTGRRYYKPDYKNPLSETGDEWFYVDMNLEKYIDLNFGKLAFNLEIKNIFNNQNSQIINPVTGKAYEYGDFTQYPSPAVNDPKYPDLTYPVDPYPYNAARYLNPRTFLFGVTFRF
ncbi:MAG: TonB-dependent receptor [Ignavibacteriales bacterium]|nr:TonB-dependent receptor [Ignavibacteriales bacterium]